MICEEISPFTIRRLASRGGTFTGWLLEHLKNPVFDHVGFHGILMFWWWFLGWWPGGISGFVHPTTQGWTQKHKTEKWLNPMKSRNIHICVRKVFRWFSLFYLKSVEHPPNSIMYKQIRLIWCWILKWNAFHPWNQPRRTGQRCPAQSYAVWVKTDMFRKNSEKPGCNLVGTCHFQKRVERFLDISIPPKPSKTWDEDPTSRSNWRNRQWFEEVKFCQDLTHSQSVGFAGDVDFHREKIALGVEISRSADGLVISHWGQRVTRPMNIYYEYHWGS